MKQISKLKIILFLALIVFAPSVFAAETFFEVQGSNILAGEEFKVNFFLNSEDENINALDGKIIFPENLLRVKEIIEGNSFINFWIEQPKFQDGEIIFSGIIPGGYINNKGLVFSIIFQSIEAGQGIVESKEIQVLLNDGDGTMANTTTSALKFTILKPILPEVPTVEPIEVEITDTEIPEMFTPVVTSDQIMFEGEYFLVFLAQDRGSGIDHYEVREGSGTFTVAESPYLLQNQNLNQQIFVKAVDKNGNERIVTLPPQKRLSWYQNYWIFVVLFVLGLILSIVLKRHNKKNP